MMRKKSLITDAKLEKRTTMRQSAEVAYDNKKEKERKEKKKRNAKMSNIYVWGALILFLTVVDIAVYHTLFLDLDLPRETAMALTLLMGALLQGMPALKGLCLEAITSRWSVFRKSKGVTALLIVVIFIGVASTIAGLWTVTTMRLGLYEFGNEFYGQARNYFAIMAPFLTSCLAFIGTYVFYPSENIIDFLERKADPLISELEEAERAAHTLEHGEVAFCKDEVAEAKANLGRAKRSVWNHCLIDGVEEEMPEDFEDFEKACIRMVNEAVREKVISAHEALPNYLDAFNNQVIRLLDCCLGMAESKSRENGYPDFLAEEISLLTSDQIIRFYNESVVDGSGKGWNNEESRKAHKKDFCNQLSLDRRRKDG